MHCRRRFGTFAAVVLLSMAALGARGQATAPQRSYDNRLTPLVDPQPLLADHPEFVEPVRDTRRFEAPALVQDSDGGLVGSRLAVFVQRPRHRRDAQPAARQGHGDHRRTPVGDRRWPGLADAAAGRRRLSVHAGEER